LHPEAVISRLLENALAEEERELQETAEAIRASMADFEAGRSVSLEDWRAQSAAFVHLLRHTAQAPLTEWPLGE
jgi:hypothetical protein